jgi:endogenous inhibitor of DNA gyrase (YacG/DUF329 family)
MVPCPVCHRPAEFSPRNRYRPFCSERCKNVDLGAWASESYSVESAPPPEGEEPPPQH